MRSLIISVLIIVLFCSATLSFLTNKITVSRNYDTSFTSLDMSNTLSAASIVIKKSKLKEIEQLKQNITAVGDSHIIQQFLKTGERPYGVSGPMDLKKSIVNRFNTVSVLAEYNRKAKTGFILGIPPPEITGGILRDAGAKAIIVSVDKRSGGASPEEVYRLCKEQYAARKFVPGPIPIIWNDYILDDIQIIHAATLGASSVVLDPDLLADDLSNKIKTCLSYALEPIVLVRNIDEANVAFEAGSKVICMRGLDENGFVELRQKMPQQSDYVYCAKFRAELDFSIYTEIDTAWVLRDNGFHSVWPSPEAIYATGVSEIYSNILAIKSKAARKYLSPRQFLMDRNKEGAREFLGNIYI